MLQLVDTDPDASETTVTLYLSIDVNPDRAANLRVERWPGGW